MEGAARLANGAGSPEVLSLARGHTRAFCTRSSAATPVRVSGALRRPGAVGASGAAVAPLKEGILSRRIPLSRVMTEVGDSLRPQLSEPRPAAATAPIWFGGLFRARPI